MQDTQARVREILAEHGKLAVAASEVGLQDDLYAAGLTSLASVNVMLACEDTFDIELPDELLRRSTFESIAAISAAVDQFRDDDEAGGGTAIDSTAAGL